MTPRLSIIAAAIRKVIVALSSVASSDYYWDNVVLAMKMDTGIDPNWSNTVLAMPMDKDPHWNNVTLALTMEGADNGSIFTDLKGSGVTGVNGALTKTGVKKVGSSSAYFSGSGSYLNIPTATIFDLSTSDFTIESWVYFNTGGTFGGAILSRRYNGANGWCIVCAASTIAWRAKINGTWQDGFCPTTGVTFETNKWYHVALERVGSVFTIYVNGVLRGTATLSGAIDDTTQPLRVGTATVATNETPFNGYIDNLRITKGAARYGRSFAIEDSSFLTDGILDLKSHSISAIGTPTLSTAQSKFGGTSLLLNGTTDYLTIPTSADFGFATGDFTVECWVKTATSGTVLDLRSSSGELGLFAISGGFISLWNGSIHLQGFTNVTTDAWVHLAWVRSAGVVSMFVNGVLDGVSATSATFGTTRPVRIGADIASANFFSGYIDDLRVSKVARYVDEFTPSKYPLLTGTSVPFLEETGKAVTVVGNTVVNTTTKQYGTGSAYFDGAGDSLTVASSADTTFGSVDFTVEFWTKHSSAGTLLYIPYGASTTHAFIQLETDASSLYANISITGSSWASSVSYGALTTSTWSHIAVVRSGGFITIFLNGVKVGSSVNVGSASIPSTSLPITIGNRNDGASGVTGYIDDLQITKGIAKYISNFTPAELATNKKTYLDPHWDKVVLGMHMDGADNGTTFTDVKGKTITVAGNTVTKTATNKFGTASAYFDGTGDYLTVSGNSDFAFGTGDFTIEFWMYPTVSSMYQYIFSTGAYSTNQLEIRLNLTDRIEIYCNLTGGMIQSPLSQNLNVWTHVSVSVNLGVVRLFINGEQVASSSPGWNITGTGAINICNSNGGSSTFNGYIDDLRITKGVARYTANFQPVQLPFPENYSGPLTIKSDPYWNNVVLAMHMDGANNGVVFTDVKGKTVTPTSAVTKTATKKFGTASAYFDGMGNYLTVANSNDFAFGSDDFTIECWVYALSIPTASNKFAFLITHDSIGISRGWELFLNDVTGPLGFLMFSDNTTYKTVMDTNPFPLNEWNHIAVSKNGPNLRLFRNGNMVAIDTTSNITIQNPNVSVLIGSSRSSNIVEALGNWNFNGYIDDLRVTKGVARYTENFVPVGSFPEVLMN